MQKICPNQNNKNARKSDHFWKFKYLKNIYRSNIRHISKSKYLNRHGFGPPLEIQMSLHFVLYN